MPQLLQPADHTTPSIILIGMAGAGKSTLGKRLAKALDFCHVDTDHLLEAWWGMKLQALSEYLSREEFLMAEAQMIQRMDIKRSVISTGGSVIYNQTSINHLKTLGTCVYLKAGLTSIQERIARNPHRGLAIAPGQSIEDLYAEREPLYQKAADTTVRTDTHSIDQCIADILQALDIAAHSTPEK